MNVRVPVVRDVVLVGGGHAHVQVVKGFGMEPVPGVRVTLVSREVHAPYSGMLPGLVAGHYDYDEAHIDLRRLCRWAGVRLLRDRVEGIAPADRRVRCAVRPPLRFDVLSLNVGSTPDTAGVPGAAEHAVPVRPVEPFLAEWDAAVEEAAARALRVAVVGGGAGGVELALAVRHRLRTLLERRGSDPDRVEIHLLTDADRILTEHNRRSRRKLARILEERSVRVHTDARVVRVEPDAVHVEGGERLPVDRTLWVTEGAPPAWIAASELDTDERGFLRVDATLRSTSHPAVFAAGDVASVDPHPRPKSGVFAVRQGPPLERNLRRVLAGREPEGFEPQREFLSLIGTGDRRAVGSRWSLAFEGAWVWKLKEWIDRRWMRRFSELPEMDEDRRAGDTSPEAARRAVRRLGGPESLAGSAAESMRCAGCGGKVEATVLERALARLEPGSRPDVHLGLEAADDAAVISVPAGKLSVQSVDFFRDFVDDPYRFGLVAATHALADVWATGAEPRAALALVTLPPAADEPLEEELHQLLSGAVTALRREGAVLAGGHTGEGDELSFGLQVTGFADPGGLLRRSGVRPGDRLVLTRALGTGTLFAADMRGRAKGRWIEAALDSMSRPHREAISVLRDHGIRACTDVTGFGLLGHLVELARASGVDIRVRTDAVPALPGALECLGAGITSTLHPGNVRRGSAIRELPGNPGDPRRALLFDPQTSGGLLGAVPGGRTEDCVDRLRAAGHPDAAVVAVAEPGTDPERPLVVE